MFFRGPAPFSEPESVAVRVRYYWFFYFHLYTMVSEIALKQLLIPYLTHIFVFIIHPLPLPLNLSNLIKAKIN